MHSHDIFIFTHGLTPSTHCDCIAIKLNSPKRYMTCSPIHQLSGAGQSAAIKIGRQQIFGIMSTFRPQSEKLSKKGNSGNSSTSRTADCFVFSIIDFWLNLQA